MLLKSNMKEILKDISNQIIILLQNI